MFTAEEFVAELTTLGVSHVVGLPDSTIGEWFAALEADDDLTLISVCREGEAWAIAAGLYVGGARPIVLIQCTGLFESGDSLRNAIFDYGLPLFGIVGYRSYLGQSTLRGDSARTFTEPVLQAWGLEYVLIDAAEKQPLLARHYRHCLDQQQPGIVLIAEGRA